MQEISIKNINKGGNFMKLLDEFSVTDRINLRLQIGEYRGPERIDLRQYIKVDKQFIPTPKGINFSSEYIDRFLEMANKLKES